MTCYICEKALGPFITTPVLELPDGTLQECCEECADREISLVGMKKINKSDVN